MVLGRMLWRGRADQAARRGYVTVCVDRLHLAARVLQRLVMGRCDAGPTAARVVLGLLVAVGLHGRRKLLVAKSLSGLRRLMWRHGLRAVVRTRLVMRHVCTVDGTHVIRDAIVGRKARVRRPLRPVP